MNALQRLILSLVSILLFSGMALSTSVSARGDDSNQGKPVSVTPVKPSSETAKSSDDSSTGGDKTSTSKTDTETEVETHASNLRDQFKTLSAQDLAAKKTQVKEHTQEERQKSCEDRKTNLTKRMSKTVKEAQAHKMVFDNIYAKAKTYHDSHGIPKGGNYDSLVATADQAQSDAAASINALQSLDISVDCTSQSVANNISTFQQAVKATRDSLKSYRKDIVAVIDDLKSTTPEPVNSGVQQ